MKSISIYGASGHGKVIIEIAEALGYAIDYVFDDDENITQLLGYPVIPINKSSFDKNTPLVFAIGNNKARYKLAENLNIKPTPPLIHPSATISPRVVIGAGSVVMPGAIINADTAIGNHCIINSGAVVEHDCILKDFVHISPNASLAGGVTVNKGAQVGIGASVIQLQTIGAWSTIGAGAVVTQDLPANCTAVGIPAKPIKFHKK